MEYYVGEKNDLYNFRSEKYLQINSCGINKVKKNDLCVIREHGRVDYHILYLISGKCIAVYDGAEHILSAGDFILYPPHKKQKYTFCAEYGTVSCYVHFTGLAAGEILEEAKIGAGVYRSAFRATTESLFNNLILQFNLKSGPYVTKCNGLLLSILSSLSPPANDAAQEYPPRILAVIKHMYLDYNKPTGPGHYAGMMNVSTSRFLHAFKAATGKSPYQFQLAIRMEKAKELMQSTDLSITRIAYEVGFGDPFYFSKFFKKHTGMSPSEYRRSFP